MAIHNQLTRQEILRDFVPENVPTRIFVLLKGAHPGVYINRVVRDCLDIDLGRAILVFERGISTKKVKRILKSIAERIEKQTAGGDLHIEVYDGGSEKEIKTLLRGFKSECVFSP